MLREVSLTRATVYVKDDSEETTRSTQPAAVLASPSRDTRDIRCTTERRSQRPLTWSDLYLRLSLHLDSFVR